jgi:hypothetical protein
MGTQRFGQAILNSTMNPARQAVKDSVEYSSNTAATGLDRV